MNVQTEDLWVHRFADRLLALCGPVPVRRDQLLALGRRLHRTCFYLVPEEVAAAEFEGWPRGRVPEVPVTGAEVAAPPVRRSRLPGLIARLAERR